MTVVPSVRSVRSRVSPAGTAIEDRIMVEQAAFDLTTLAASVKVQLVARLARTAASVGAGAAGAARAKEALVTKRLTRVEI